MTLVRGRADARWLPSRYNFAIFRLAAYLRLRRARAETAQVSYFIDRHQSATENWLVGIWVTLTIACYIAASVFAEWPLIASLPLSIVLSAVVGIELPVVISGAIVVPVWKALTRLKGENQIRFNSIVVMMTFVLAAVHFAAADSWARYAAWQFLAIVIANAVASVIVFLLRAPIARLEADVRGAASAV